MRLLNTRLGRNDKKFNAEARIKETIVKDFFRGLYWVVFLLVLIIIVGILGQLNGGDMNMYLKAMRINNG